MKSVLHPLLRHASTILLLLVLCLLGANARAATYIVTNLNDSGPGSLRAAIGSANSASGSTINFQTGLSGTIFLLSNNPTITGNTTVQGPGPSVITIDGQHKLGGAASDTGAEPFYVYGGATVSISGLTIQNGYSSGIAGALQVGDGAYNMPQPTVTLNNCIFSNNAAYSEGGAISNYGTLLMTGCTLTANHTLSSDAVSTAGGAIMNRQGSVTMTRCSLIGNSSLGSGSGICLYNNLCSLIMTNCMLDGNTGSYAILDSEGTITLTNCTLSGNTGGVAKTGSTISGGSATLTNDIIYGNGSGSEFLSVGNPSVSECDIKGGYSGTGNFDTDPLFVRVPVPAGNGGSGGYPGGGYPGGGYPGGGYPGGSGSQAPDYGDLHLKPLSPCIGKGTSSAPAYLPTDLDGNPRNTPPSIGAYESHEIAAGISVGADNLTRMLWDNPSGSASLRRVNADGSVTTATYGPYADSGGVWQAVAIATGPNGVTCLLWTNPDGRVTLWYINPDGSYGVTGAYSATVDSGGVWRATALSIGPDNVAHILWNNPDGRATLWYVNPDASYGVIGAYGPYTDSGGIWRAKAVATGPNGVSRILWNNPDGRATLWYVNPGGAYGVTGAYAATIDSGGTWRATAVSVGPDNVAHILWDNPDGRSTLWYINPDASYGLLGVYAATVDSGGTWGAFALVTGPNGISRILWVDPNGIDTLWYVNPGGAYGLSGTYGPYMN